VTIVAVLVGILVVVLLVAWLSDRRDAPGGAGRFRDPGAIEADAKRFRQGARWRRAMSNRWMSQMGSPNDRDVR
jgi:hypothetical protein